MIWPCLQCIGCLGTMSWGLVDYVMWCDMYMCTYAMEQYEFSNNWKSRMVLLPRGLYRVSVKGFHSAISLWHELSKSAPTEGFVEQVDLLLVSLWNVGDWTFLRGVVV